MATFNEVSVTVAVAAKSLGVSTQTIWRWIGQGRLSAYRVGPKRVRIRVADLDGMVTPLSPKRPGGAVETPSKP